MKVKCRVYWNSVGPSWAGDSRVGWVVDNGFGTTASCKSLADAISFAERNWGIKPKNVIIFLAEQRSPQTYLGTGAKRSLVYF